MAELKKQAIEDSSEIARARKKAAGKSVSGRMALGLALGRAGCGYEAACLLRPLRRHWQQGPWAGEIDAWLADDAWWRKHSREFVRLRRETPGIAADNRALKLLGDRPGRRWDHPPLLAHLAEMAFARRDHALAFHLYQRLEYLTTRPVPRIPLAAFRYVARSGIIALLAATGHPHDALEKHREIRPNHGNVFAHAMQETGLLVACGRLDEALLLVARMLTTARFSRSGWSARVRERFVAASPELKPLRKCSEWKHLVQDPRGWLRLQA